jgi:glutathione synthase/RimK-type ligase-like ATP-grasp enzyme
VLVRWNLHKSYMADLAARGVAVVPTVHTPASDPRTLADIMRSEGWKSAVVKPAVSLSAYETWRVDTPAAVADEERLTRLRARGDVLVQRYVPEVATAGEWSLVFFGRTFSHAVRKLPRDGDFRVQTEHGGSVNMEHPPAAVLDAAAHALANLPTAPAYCRIDGVSEGGRLLLMEAECIDPVLFFTEHPAAADAFTDEVMTRIERAPTSRDGIAAVGG